MSKLQIKLKDYKILSEEIIYSKDLKKLLQKVLQFFNKKYDIKSKDIFYSANDELVGSNYKTKITTIIQIFIN